jgi:hypothetical protein
VRRLFLALVLLFAAPALASDDPVRDTRQIMAGTVTTAKIKNEYLSGLRDGTAAFKGALNAYKAVRAAEKPAPTTKTCQNGSVVPIAQECPVPVQPPHPPVQPAPVTTVGGEPDILDNFDTAKALVVAAEIAKTAAPDLTGAFRFFCGPGQLNKDDPLVYPGQPGAAHLHQFFGNTGTNAYSDYASLRTTGGTTCGDSATPVQRTAYWIPAMLDGAGNAVKPDYMLTYYKAIPASNPACGAPDATHVGLCVPLPNGLRFIFGFDMKTGKGGPTDANSWDSAAFAFQCAGPTPQGEAGQRVSTIRAVVGQGICSSGDYLRVAASIPQCWDGKNLDSADHRSHMAYPDGPLVAAAGKRACPSTHPYILPELAASFFFKVDANFVAGKWRLSSDEMYPDRAAGTTMHMDYWEAWSPTVKAAWQANCIDRQLSCNNGNLGNGQQVKGMETPPGGFPVPAKVPLASIPGVL